METTIYFLLTVIFFIGIFYHNRQKRKKLAAALAPYDDAVRLSKHYLKVVLNKKCGVINNNGKIIVPLHYDEVKLGPLPETFSVAELTPGGSVLWDLRWGLYNKKLIVPCRFASVEYSEKYKCFVTPNPENNHLQFPLFGLYSLDGNQILKDEWEKCKLVDNDLFLVSYHSYSQKDYAKLVNRAGMTVIPKSSYILPFGDVFFVIHEQDNHEYRAVYDKLGREVIPFERFASRKHENVIILLGKKHFYLNDHSGRHRHIYDLDGKLKFTGCGRTEKYNGLYGFTVENKDNHYVIVDEDLNLIDSAEKITYDPHFKFLILHHLSGDTVIGQNQQIVHNVRKYISFDEKNYMTLDHQGNSNLYYQGRLVHRSFYEIVPFQGCFKVKDREKVYYLTPEGKKTSVPRLKIEDAE